MELFHAVGPSPVHPLKVMLMSGGESEELRKPDSIRRKLMELGIDVEFSDEHYSKTHRDVKILIEKLLEKVEALTAPSLTFTTSELEYIVHYLNRWHDEPMASRLLEKLVDEIRRRQGTETPKE